MNYEITIYDYEIGTEYDTNELQSMMLKQPSCQYLHSKNDNTMQKPETLKLSFPIQDPYMLRKLDGDFLHHLGRNGVCPGM